MTAKQKQQVPYFRRDRKEGISPPDLSKQVDFADHIVEARGKRTQFTSVSKAPGKIGDLGDQLYRVKRDKLDKDGHSLVEHELLMDALREQVQKTDRASRLKAAQALRYARKRLEGLIDWQFDIRGVERKDLLTWAAGKVRGYFSQTKG